MFHKIIVGLVGILVAAASGLAAQPAAAAPERPLAQVTILSTGQLTDGGAAITVRLLVRCRAGRRYPVGRLRQRNPGRRLRLGGTAAGL